MLQRKYGFGDNPHGPTAARAGLEPLEIRGAMLNITAAPRPYARSRALTVERLTLTPSGPTEVLVRVEAAGVCHSDLSVVDGSRPQPLPMLVGDGDTTT